MITCRCGHVESAHIPDFDDDDCVLCSCAEFVVAVGQPELPLGKRIPPTRITG